jgi:hypothetical protein
MFIENGHVFTMPENDTRGFPDTSADAPFDVDGYHWKEGWPDKPGYYAVALAKEWFNSPFYLPVEKAYYEGNYHWSRRRCPRGSLLHEKYIWEDEDGSCECYTYYPEYWCEIPESGELIPCLFNY